MNICTSAIYITEYSMNMEPGKEDGWMDGQDLKITANLSASGGDAFIQRDFLVRTFFCKRCKKCF